MSDPAQPPQPAAAAAVAAADEHEGIAPSFSSPAEQQAFQAALLSSVQSAQSVAESRAAVSGADAAAVPVDDVQLHVTPGSSTNAHTVLCRFCDTKVLLADAATFCDKELSLHRLGGSKDDPARDTLREHWLVPSQMNFENVGVTRGVDPAYRYLTCANWSAAKQPTASSARALER